jgi:hypothetical protein
MPDVAFFDLGPLPPSFLPERRVRPSEVPALVAALVRRISRQRSILIGSLEFQPLGKPG